MDGKFEKIYRESFTYTVVSTEVEFRMSTHSNEFD